MEVINNVSKKLNDDLKEGTLDSEELRGIENGKISCAKKLFSSIRTREIHYEHVSTYQDLMDKVIRNQDR